MDKFQIKSLFESLLEKRGTWWHDHQSRKECILGSDGVGHDLIHPVDKLRSSLRNLWSLTSAVYGYKLSMEEKEIEVQECLDNLEVFAEPDARKYELNKKKLEIALERAQFGLMCSKMQFEDRITALTAFYDHSNELYEAVKDKYSSFDDALDDIWTARLAYQALVGGHPLGQSIKTALMDEEKKFEALKLIAFPTDQFRTPNSNEILRIMDSKKLLKDGVKDGEGLLADIRDPGP